MVRKLDANGKPTNELETIGNGPTTVRDDEKWEPLEVKKGTAVLIHGTVIHKSENNTSSLQRPIFTWHMFDKACVEWDSRNWLQPQRGPFWPVFETDPNGTENPSGWESKESDTCYNN